MSENLKVNAKSSILEFKRKHNKLVEKVSGVTKLYKHTLRFRNTETEPVKEINIDIVSIRGTAYSDLSTIVNDKNYEILSYGNIIPEDSPCPVIGFEDSGMDTIFINYIGSSQLGYEEVNEFVSDTVTDL